LKVVDTIHYVSIAWPPDPKPHNKRVVIQVIAVLIVVAEMPSSEVAPVICWLLQIQILATS